MGFFLVVSFFGLAVVTVALFYPLQASESIPLRKSLVGILYSTICIAGMIAVVFPGQCSRAVSFGGEKNKSRGLASGGPTRKKLSFRGHHPDCGNFSTHVVRVGNRNICAGCTGLFIGGLAAFVGSLLYFFGGFNIEQAGFLLPWAGATGVAIGLLQSSLYSILRSSVRSLVNAFFAFGAFLLLVGVDYIAQNIFVDIFLVVLVAFWILTKIALSRWNHDMVCRQCKVSDCELRGF
ncbi:MAG: hypothetical protein ABH852_04570 [Methanobacteriota archaeon]